MKKPETISLYEFFKMIPDEEAARLYSERKRWNGAPVCGHCESTDVAECKDHKPMAYRCRTCRQHFSVRTGTVLAESRLPLHKWLMAIYMLTTARKDISSTQMARELGITQKSAWFLAQRIRETWLGNQSNDHMCPHVQVDECYIGGRETNKHASKKLRQGRGAVGKQPVIGVRTESGAVKSAPVPNTTRATLCSFIRKHVSPGSTAVTDNFSAYRGLSEFTHITVNHSIGEYVRDMAHTNGIESFWALLKRGYYGIYHYMSVKHLNRYVHEFSFRQNTAQRSTMNFIDATIDRMAGQRLTYKRLINA